MASHQCAPASWAHGIRQVAGQTAQDVCGDDSSEEHSGGGYFLGLFRPLYGGRTFNVNVNGNGNDNGNGNGNWNGNGGKIYTFEINDEQEPFTRKWIEESPWAEYVTFIIGDVAEKAKELGVKFDMAFLDGDKKTYVETYEAILPLMNPGAFILADNTLWDGHVIDPEYDRDHQTQGIRRFNDHIKNDPRVSRVILPLRDGLTIIRVHSS